MKKSSKRKYAKLQLAKPKRGKQELTDEQLKSIPRSFVFPWGNALSKYVRQLAMDWRTVMKPHTAENLQVKRRNVMRDFVEVAKVMFVSHIITFSQTEKGVYMSIGRTPRGPTITFKIDQYSLAHDVLMLNQGRYSMQKYDKRPPLVVLNNFGDTENHLKLTATMLQNMFPAIDVQKVELKSCNRVILFNYDKERKMIDVRHYVIKTSDANVSSRVDKLLTSKSVPDLGDMDDISEYMTRPGDSDVESDAEDGSRRVEIAKFFTGKKDGKNIAVKQQKKIRLREIGPRISMSIYKITEGVYNGDVLYNAFSTLSKEEIAKLKAEKARKRAEKEKRKAEQKANVEEKKRIKEEKKKERKERHEQRLKEAGEAIKREVEEEEAKQAADADNIKKVRFANSEQEDAYYGDGQDQDSDSDIDDAEWYRREVGEEPEVGMFPSANDGANNKADKREKYNPLYKKKEKKKNKGDGSNDDNNNNNNNAKNKDKKRKISERQQTPKKKPRK